MTETVFYKRVGRKYVPVSYYDHEVIDSVPEGSHLIVKREGSTMRLYNVDPALAPMIAAGHYAEDAICQSIMEASKLRCPKDRQPITPEQKRTWEHLASLFGQETYPLEWPCYRESAEAGVQALEQEAAKLLTHPSVQAAYDHFVLTCKLVSENKHE
jgi:hypothetical protein